MAEAYEDEDEYYGEEDGYADDEGYDDEEDEGPAPSAAAKPKGGGGMGRAVLFGVLGLTVIVGGGVVGLQQFAPETYNEVMAMVGLGEAPTDASADLPSGEGLPATPAGDGAASPADAAAAPGGDAAPAAAAPGAEAAPPDAAAPAGADAGASGANARPRPMPKPPGGAQTASNPGGAAAPGEGAPPAGAAPGDGAPMEGMPPGGAPNPNGPPGDGMMAPAPEATPAPTPKPPTAARPRPNPAYGRYFQGSASAAGRRALPGGGGRYAVQVGSFADVGNATALVRQLRSQGIPAAVAGAGGGGGGGYTVRSVGFREMGNANRVADAYRKAGYPARMVPVGGGLTAVAAGSFASEAQARNLASAMAGQGLDAQVVPHGMPAARPGMARVIIGSYSNRYAAAAKAARLQAVGIPAVVTLQ